MIVSELLPAVKYSFIIATYNRKSLISNAIDSVLFFIGNDKRYEVIIIDDGSTDGCIVGADNGLVEGCVVGTDDG